MTTIDNPKPDPATDLAIVASDCFEYANEMGDDLDEVEIGLCSANCGEQDKELRANQMIRKALASIRAKRITIMAIVADHVPDEDEGPAKRATEPVAGDRVGKAMTNVQATVIRHSAEDALEHHDHARQKLDALYALARANGLDDDTVDLYGDAHLRLHKLRCELETIASQVKDERGAS